METTTTPVKRPGGRSAAVMSAIKVAVEELIAERGRDRVTIPMIAERAGVNPTSVYRRWGDLPTMINDIATYRLDPRRPIPSGPDLKANLTAWAQEIIEHYGSPVNAELLRGGASSAGETESDCTRNRRAEATIMVERAGESSPVSVEDVIDYLVAPIIYRIIFLPWTLDGGTAERLVERLFAGR